jgi:hypothetical protein
VAGGNVELQTGGTARLTVSPTTATFADTATALTITPVSAGTTSLIASSTVTAFNMSQDIKTSGTGAILTIQAQGTSSGTGGKLVLSSGLGTVAGGNIELQTEGYSRLTVSPTAAIFADTAAALTVTPVSIGATSITIASGVTSFDINQTLGGGTGAPLTIEAQTTSSGVGGQLLLKSGAGGFGGAGGKIILSSGNGSAAGNIEIQTAGTPKLIVSSAATTFADTATALTITPVSSGGTTSIMAAANVLQFTISQTTTSSHDGYQLSILSQSSSNGRGGDLTVAAGTSSGGSGQGGDLLLSAGNGSSNLGGDVLINMGTGSADGYFMLNTMQTAATASSGGSSLPAQPVGFIILYINGVKRKIPYYDP